MRIENSRESNTRIEWHLMFPTQESAISGFVDPGENITRVCNIPDEHLIIHLHALRTDAHSEYTKHIGTDDISFINAALAEIWNKTKSKEIRDQITLIEDRLTNVR